ncbi:MAG: hypothetical protein K940chlam6_01690, partial [Chlamydiae bacterium]|nr:hypothetical protein [Chlamydiota bacterium]
ANGYDNIPKMDLTKHIASIGPNFSEGQTYPRCDVKLSTEGYELFYQHGLEKCKHMFKAFLSNDCPIRGVIRNY